MKLVEIEWDFTPNLVVKFISVYIKIVKLVAKNEKFLYPQKSYFDLMMFCWVFGGASYYMTGAFNMPDFGKVEVSISGILATITVCAIGVAIFRNVQLIKIAVEAIYWFIVLWNKSA